MSVGVINGSEAEGELRLRQWEKQRGEERNNQRRAWSPVSQALQRSHYLPGFTTACRLYHILISSKSQSNPFVNIVTAVQSSNPQNTIPCISFFQPVHFTSGRSAVKRRAAVWWLRLKGDNSFSAPNLIFEVWAKMWDSQLQSFYFVSKSDRRVTEKVHVY